LEGYENYPGGAWFSGQVEGGFKTPDRGRVVEEVSSRSRVATAHAAPRSPDNALPSVSLLDGSGASLLDDEQHSVLPGLARPSPAAAAAASFSFASSSSSALPGTASALASDPCWVIIFGFPSSQTSQVIEEMLSCGQIVSFHADNPLNNWVHVQFETSLGAQRALTRDGSVLERLGGLMIGVRRSSGRDAKPRVIHSSTTSLATQSLFLQQQQRSGLSVTSSQLAYGFAPYAINSWWSRFKFYVFGMI
jgi:hypothetical protein